MPHLTKAAMDGLKMMSRPASPVDRPGDWMDFGVIDSFGDSAVIELIKAGLIQRGGVPAPVPEIVAAAYPENMAMHEQLCAKCEGRDAPLYPASDDILFITHSGWEKLLSQRGFRP